MPCCGCIGAFQSGGKAMRVIQVLSGLHIGGVQSVVMSYYRHIDKSRVQFDFAIIDKDNGEYGEEVLRNGSRIFRVRDWSKDPLGFCKDFEAILKQNKDITAVHAHMNYFGALAAAVAKKCGIKNITVHAHSNYETKSFIKKLIRRVMRFIILKDASAMLACSEVAGEWLFGAKVVKSDRFCVLKNAIDYVPYFEALGKRDEYRSELGIAPEKKALVNVSSVTPVKNQAFLVDLLAALNKDGLDRYRLVIVGDGVLRKQLEQQAESLGVSGQVVFCGWQTDTAKYLAAGDVFVFPSLFEGFSIVTLEAQASGLDAVISDNVPDFAVVNERIVKKLELDIDKWKAYIEALAEKSPEQRLADCRESRTDEFDINICVKKLAEIYLREG